MDAKHGKVLLALWWQDEWISSDAVAAQAETTKRVASDMLWDLRDAGLVKTNCRGSKTDPRLIRWCLSADGRRFVAAIRMA